MITNRLRLWLTLSSRQNKIKNKSLTISFLSGFYSAALEGIPNIVCNVPKIWYNENVFTR